MILYVETNFPISIATGRDNRGNTLLLTTPRAVQIAIPSICVMEALSFLEVDLKSRRRFNNELLLRSSEAKRNLTSVYAQSLRFHLKQAIVQNEASIEEFEALMPEIINQLATKAEMINLTADILQENWRTRLIAEPTDNLILNCILNHARLHTTEVKVLLSGNSNDFGRREVREVLRSAGVENYFSRTEDFLGWLELQ